MKMTDVINCFIPAPVSAAYFLLKSRIQKKTPSKVDQFFLFAGITAIAGNEIHHILQKTLPPHSAIVFDCLFYVAFPQAGRFKYAYTAAQNGMATSGKNTMIKIALLCFATSQPVTYAASKFYTSVCNKIFS